MSRNNINKKDNDYKGYYGFGSSLGGVPLSKKQNRTLNIVGICTLTLLFGGIILQSSIEKKQKENAIPIHQKDSIVSKSQNSLTLKF